MSNELVKHEHGEPATVERTCGGVTFTPRVDIVETETELLLYADLPGVAPEDLDVRYEKGELSLVGKVAQRNGGAEYLAAEYGIGDFYRQFSIGEAVDAEQISAEMKEGVLTVHLPKTEAVKPRRIEVSGA